MHIQRRFIWKKTDTELNDDKADTGKVYEVKCEYSDEGTGLVTNITVTETNT